jgi:large subunit ribosomal protein L17
MKTLLGSLIIHEKVTTTEAKAKEVKLFVDQVINKAKEARSNADRRVTLLRQLNQEVPAMAVKKLSGDFMERFESRQSGYTRVVKLEPRKGDGARMAIIEFV